MSDRTSTAVLDVSGLRWASEQNVVNAKLGRQPGVLDVSVNPTAQTATVVFDPTHTSVATLRQWVIDCGYHCTGQSVPHHICDPMEEPDRAGHDHHDDHAETLRSPHEAMGHGGHAGMSMAAMVADMRNRFLVALVFSLPIVLWSPIGTEVFGLHLPTPFGVRQDVWALVLSLPVIFYSCSACR